VNDRVATAVLGTGSRPWTPSTAPVHAWLPAGPLPWRLLLEAGVDELRARAGRALGPGQALPTAPPEHRAQCSPELAAVLQELLRHRDRDLVALVLDRLAARGRRVPPALLPALLRDARIRALPNTWIAGGERAAWLADQRRGWAPPGPLAVHGDLLEEGTPRERLETLRQLVATDPAAAVAWLEPAIGTEPAATRRAWLALFDDPPPAVAEPLLVQALTDRSRKVRERASALLRSLPGSELAQACAGAGVHCLAWQGGRWDVVLPASWDPDWGEPPPGPDEGARTRQAGALIATVPLGAWTAATGRTPVETVAALDPSDAFVAVAWRHAALVARDTAWLTALMDRALGTGETGSAYGALIDALPSEILALRAPRALRVRDWAQLLPLLKALDRPWPLPVARAWVARFYELAQQVQHGQLDPPADALQSVRAAALALPAPLLVLDTRTWVDRLAPSRGQALVAQALDDLAHVLAVRRRLEELLPAASGEPRE